MECQIVTRANCSVSRRYPVTCVPYGLWRYIVVESGRGYSELDGGSDVCGNGKMQHRNAFIRPEPRVQCIQ